MPYNPDGFTMEHVCLLSQMLDSQSLCSFNFENILNFFNYYKTNKNYKVLKFRIMFHNYVLIEYTEHSLSVVNNKLQISENYTFFSKKKSQIKLKRGNTSARVVLKTQTFLYRKFLGDFLIGIEVLLNNLILGTYDITSLYCLFTLNKININNNNTKLNLNRNILLINNSKQPSNTKRTFNNTKNNQINSIKQLQIHTRNDQLYTIIMNNEKNNYNILLNPVIHDIKNNLSSPQIKTDPQFNRELVPKQLFSRN